MTVWCGLCTSSKAQCLTSFKSFEMKIKWFDVVKVVKLEIQRENNENYVETFTQACLFSDNYRINV